jgi:hypothetical protein
MRGVAAKKRAREKAQAAADAMAAEEARIDATGKDEWSYIQNGEQFGPVSLVELRSKISDLSIEPPVTAVWTEGMNDWRLVYEVRKVCEPIFSTEAKTDQDSGIPDQVESDDHDGVIAAADFKAAQDAWLAAAAKGEEEWRSKDAQDARAVAKSRAKAKEEETRTKTREEGRLIAEAEAKAANEADLRAVAEANAAKETKLRLAAEAKAAEEARLRAVAEANAAEEVRIAAAAKAKAEKEAKLRAAEVKALEQEQLRAVAEIKSAEKARLRAAAEAKTKEEAKLKAAAEAKAAEQARAAAAAEKKIRKEARAKTAEQARAAKRKAKEQKLRIEKKRITERAIAKAKAESTKTPWNADVFTKRVWFYTCEGDRLGPVSFEELRTMAANSSLDPRLDMVWKKDMDAWKPAGQINGLCERRSVPVETAKPPAAPAASYRPTHHGSLVLTGKDVPWPGARRRSLLLATLVFPFAWQFVLSRISPFLIEQFGQILMARILPLVALLPIVVLVYFALSRLANLGMSRWWHLAVFAPGLNLWLGYRCFVCPSGYACHKKLDGPGIALAIPYWLVILSGILILAGGAPRFDMVDNLKLPAQVRAALDSASSLVSRTR